MDCTQTDNDIPGVGQVTGQLFISGTRALLALPALRQRGITHVLKLYFDEPSWPEDFIVFDHPLEDGVFIERMILHSGVMFLRETIEAGHNVIVVCGLGISRSSTFILAYLLEAGYDLRDAYDLLIQARPQASPMRALWRSLLTHYPSPYTLDDVEQWDRKS
jgi:protein-tyrosine phosphatase